MTEPTRPAPASPSWGPSLLGLAAILLSLAGPAAAQGGAPAGVRVKRIVLVRVGSSQSVSDRQVLSRMELKEGRSYGLDAFFLILDGDIKRLFKYGIEVTQVEPRVPSGVFDLKLWVRERLLVGSLSFEGVSEMDEEDVEGEVKKILAVGAASDPSLLRYACERIRALYVKEGYRFARVDYETEPMGGGRTHVIVRIFEGTRPKISAILFRGNRSVSPQKLLDQMETDDSSFLDAEYLDETQFRKDLKAVEQYYREEGWRDASVYLEDITYNDAFDGMTVVIRVEEGRRYRVRSVAIEGNEAFDEAALRKVIKLEPGMYYRRVYFAGNRMRGEKGDATAIKGLYGNKGYMFCRIDTRERFDPDKHVVDVTYRIDEGQRVKLGKVEFRGNHKTRDDVLRSYLMLRPGEYPRLADLEYTILRMANTRWFKNVNPTWEDTEDPTVKNLVIDVEEDRTGDIRFVLGYNTSSSLTGQIQLSFSNFDLGNFPTSFDDLLSGNSFAGGGQLLKLAFTIGMEKQLVYAIEFTEPRFFGLDTGLKVGGYRRQRQESRYLRRTTEGSLEFTQHLGRFLDGSLSGSAGYSLKEVELKAISPYASWHIQDSEGPNLISALSLGLSFSTIRREMMQPYQGFSVKLGAGYAGGFLLGDVNYAKARFDFALYQTVWDRPIIPIPDVENYRQILSFKFNVEWIEPHTGQNFIPVYERFYAGGLGTIRGFERWGIGPRDGYDAIGGNFLATASLEYSIPLYRAPMSPGSRMYLDVLRMVFFYDAAALASDIKDFSTALIRTSVGFGFRLRIPALQGIPISLDFGFPLSRQPEDETQRVAFTIGFFFM